MIWKNLSTASFLTLAVAVMPAPPVIAQTPAAEELPAAQETQVGEECRLVNISRGGLNVRQQPAANSPIVAVLANGADVAIVNRGARGWVPISAPVDGFVSASYLTYCGGVGGPANPVIPDNCREVNAYNGLNVRQRPSIYSPIVTTLADERTVNIVNRGTDGWVPIESPYQGYVSGNYLSSCSLNQAN